MKKSILFLVVLFSLTGYSQIVILQPENAKTAGKYKKLEIGLNLPEEVDKQMQAFFINSEQALNPFDSAQINVFAYFLSPSGMSYQRVGFYYEEFIRDVENNIWHPKAPVYKWRFRFAPDELGRWECRVYFSIKGKQATELGSCSFVCVASGKKGPVIKNHFTDERGRYLQFKENDSLFFAVGESIGWIDWKISTKHKEKPETYVKQQQFIKEFARQNGSLLRLGILPMAYDFEWEKLGNYKERMHLAWELDQVFEIVEKEDFYLLFWTYAHNVFLGKYWDDPYTKKYNPYFNEIEEVKQATDFFTTKTARQFTKQKLRYIMARWGYSPNILAYELLSEADNHVFNQYNQKSGLGNMIFNAKEYQAGIKQRKQLEDWFTDLQSYIHTNLGKEKLVSLSFTQNANRNIGEKIFTKADINLIHHYGRKKQTDEHRLRSTSKFLQQSKTQNKPVIFNEVGSHHLIDDCIDVDNFNTMWVTAFSGSFGAAMPWNWDNNHKKGRRNVLDDFRAINVFFANEDLHRKPYRHVYENKGVFKLSYLISKDRENALGWVHNNSFWWANYDETDSCIHHLIHESPIELKGGSKVSFRKYKDGKLKVLNHEILKIKNLKPSSLFHGKKTYQIHWYYTHGKGGIVPDKTEIVKTNCWGRARFTIPTLDAENPDYGFKIKEWE